jgi:hypothetical protein
LQGSAALAALIAGTNSKDDSLEKNTAGKYLAEAL